MDVGISFNVSVRAREGEDGDEEDGDCPWGTSAMKGDPEDGPDLTTWTRLGKGEGGWNKEGEEPGSQVSS